MRKGERKTHCKHGHPLTPENTYVNADGTRNCITCVKARTAKWQKENRASVVERSRRWRERHGQKVKDHIREWQLKKKYGMTIADFDLRLASQNHTCPILLTKHSSENPLMVDHCHEKGHVRALLSRGANLALGYLNDDPNNALRLLKYILKDKGIQVDLPDEITITPCPSVHSITT